MIQIEKIKNYNQLISKGDSQAREKVLQLMDYVLKEMDARKAIHAIMRLDGNILTVGERTWDLSKKKNVYLVGAGKACNAMAQAVCEVLGERLTKGIISVKIAESADCYINTEVYVGGHPLPNAEGLAAAEKMLELADNACADDLFISVISGGSSALLTCPVDGITLEDEMLAQDLLLKTGAKILEINAVRRHISKTNGGRLAERILHRGCEMIGLFVSDAVGVMPFTNPEKPRDFFGTPSAPDRTTIQDARDMIINYDLADKLPKSIVDYVTDDSKIKETPKKINDRATMYVLNGVADSCEAAIRAADKMGIPVLVLSTFLEGESREAGVFISSIVREIRNRKRPIKPPCFIVCSGETTTNITSPPSGIGGPSQEMVLGFAIAISGMEGVAGASIDTEGTDGTTTYAGGITDGQTVKRLEERGINIYKALRNHSAGNALEAIGDSIFTGNTGTNVCDLNIFYISE